MATRNRADDAQALSSPQLAHWLRSGPLRSMLDRVVRSAAEAAGLPYMVLGIRHTDFYEFIATHGMPLTHYVDRVPATLLGTQLFTREVEVADLQKQAQFTALGIAPVAKTWRYGGNVPIPLQQPLSDDGVLALSGAHVQLCQPGGRILAIMRRHAGFIADLIWLGNQVQQSQLATNPAQVVGTVLQAATAGTSQPICLIDSERRVQGQSEQFAGVVRQLGGQPPAIGQPLSGPWLGPDLTAKIDAAVAESRALRMVTLTSPGAQDKFLDVFPLSFGSVGRFAVVSIVDERYLLDHVTEQHGQEIRPVLAGQADPPGPLTSFLAETLIVHERLQHRNDTSYVGVRRWRSAIRKYQIAALRALKDDPPDAFVRMIAAEMVATVRKVYGSPGDCVIIPVPCGHSGENCLAHRLAQAVGELLHVPVVHAFAPIEGVRGRSHPRKNGRRAPMKLKQFVSQRVILVDDVSTSGSHIDEAASVLRKTASSVWPVVWIAA